MSTLGGKRLVHCELYFPPSGGAIADVRLEQGAVPPAGLTTLTIGDLPIVGRVLPNRAGFDAPASPHAMFACGAGWGTLLPSTGGAYASAGGVRLSTVLTDLARISGETIDMPSEYLLGQSYNWPASRAGQPVRCRNVLADLVLRGAIPTWRANIDGHTRFDTWPTLPAADQHLTLIGNRDTTRGTRMFSVKGSVAALLPGASADGATIVAVQFKETGEAIEAKTWDSTAPSESQSMKGALLRLFPWLSSVGVDLASGALSVKSAAGRTALEGGGPGVGRVGDSTDGGGYEFYPGIPGTTPPSLWYTANQAPGPYTWTQVVTCPITGPLSTDGGTRVAGVIKTGSKKVTSG